MCHNKVLRPPQKPEEGEGDEGDLRPPVADQAECSLISPHLRIGGLRCPRCGLHSRHCYLHLLSSHGKPDSGCKSDDQDQGEGSLPHLWVEPAGPFQTPAPGACCKEQDGEGDF